MEISRRRVIAAGGVLAGAGLTGADTRPRRDARPGARRKGVPPGRSRRPRRPVQHRGRHGLGVDLDQPWYMGRLAGRWSFGHTGFTGTSVVGDPGRGTIAVLLTNRVHPSRHWGSINAARRAVADAAVHDRG